MKKQKFPPTAPPKLENRLFCNKKANRQRSLNVKKHSDNNKKSKNGSNTKFKISITTYKKMCIDALKKKWQDDFIDINVAIQKLKKRDSQWCNVSKISSADRNVLFYFIRK